MKINVRTVDQYSGIVEVDGVAVGDVSDCDLGRWVLVGYEDGHPLEGCYPASDLWGVAYAIRECHDGVTEITLDGTDIDSASPEAAAASEW